jgi:hypothetical protein
MASEVSICNLALSHLGDEATVTSIDPAEGSQQAEHCALYYPIARNTLLELHPWSFATRRQALVELEGTAPGNWGFVYQRPNNCLRALNVFADGASTARNNLSVLRDGNIVSISGEEFGEEFIEETLDGDVRVIYANVENAQLRYIRQVEDTTKYPTLVVNAIARLLASMLAGPIIKGTTGMQVGQAQLKQYYETDLRLALTADANTGHLNTYNNFTSSAAAARA